MQKVRLVVGLATFGAMTVAVINLGISVIKRGWSRHHFLRFLIPCRCVDLCSAQRCGTVQHQPLFAGTAAVSAAEHVSMWIQRPCLTRTLVNSNEAIHVYSIIQPWSFQTCISQLWCGQVASVCAISPQPCWFPPWSLEHHGEIDAGRLVWATRQKSVKITRYS